MSQDFFNKMGITKEQAADLLREAQYEQAFKIKNEIYIDLAYIQDYKLGMLLALFTEQDEYKYIYSRIPIYNERFDDFCAKYFPDLEITDEELNAYVTNPEYTANLIKTAPMTLGFYAFRDKFQEMVDYNKLIGEMNVSYNAIVNIHPLTLNPNVHDETTSKRIKKFIKDRIKFIHADTNVFIADYPIQDMTFKMFQNIDLFLIMDLNGLLSTEQKKDWMLRQGKKEHSAILCPKYHENPSCIEGADDETIERVFRTGEATMKLVCDFVYCNPKILLEKDISSEDAMATTEKND